MYQSELRYDPPYQEAWTHDKIYGYASYKVNDNVTIQETYVLGVYCVFFASPSVTCYNGYESLLVAGINIKNILTLNLVGKEIAYVINGIGNIAKAGDKVQRILKYP